MSERRDGEERKPRDCSSVRGVCKYFWMATHVMPVYKDCSSMLDAENVEGGGGVIDCEPLATFDGQPWPAFEAVSSTDEMRSRLDKRAQQLAVFENKKKSVANLKLQRMRDKIERTEMFLQQREELKKQARFLNVQHARERAKLKESLRNRRRKFALPGPERRRRASSKAGKVERSDSLGSCSDYFEKESTLQSAASLDHQHLRVGSIGTLEGGQGGDPDFFCGDLSAEDLGTQLSGAERGSPIVRHAQQPKVVYDSETGERIVLVDVARAHGAGHRDTDVGLLGVGGSARGPLSMQQQDSRPSFGKKFPYEGGQQPTRHVQKKRHGVGSAGREAPNERVSGFMTGREARVHRGKSAQHASRGNLAKRFMAQPSPSKFFESEFATHSMQHPFRGSLGPGDKFGDDLNHLDEMRKRQMKSLSLLLDKERVTEIERQAAEASAPTLKEKHRLQKKFHANREKARHRILRIAREHELALASRMAAMGLIR